MKLSTRTLGVAAIVGASVLLLASPAAADPWPVGNNYVIGGTDWGLRTGGAGIGHTYDEAGNLSSVSHHFSELYLDGTSADCNDLTAVLSIDAGTGDVIITCDAEEVIPGLWVTPQFRLYATGDLARMFFTIENRTGAEIDANNFYFSDNYDYYGVQEASSGDTSGVLSGADEWVIVSDTSGTTVTGSAWAITGDTLMTSSGDIASEQTYHNFLATTFAAGSTTYVANFVTIDMPVAPFGEPEEQAAFAAASARMGEFDSFNGRLVASLPEGITVLNWGATPAAAPALAATGVDTTTYLAAGGGALALTLAGVALLSLRRRRTA